MKKLTAIIVDDEQDSIITLKWELEVFDDKIEVINSYQSPIKAISAIQKQRPNILFLDIQMPEMNGFELLEKVSGYFDHVVFITAFNEYAIQAFEVSAVDYILKPIEAEKLSKCLAKLEGSFSKDVVREQLELLLNKLNKDNQIDKIALPTMEGLLFVKFSDIVYCQSDGNYTVVVMKNSNKIIVSKTLKEIESALPSKVFYRIHHRYLINLNYLQKYYKGNNAYVLLDDKIQIPVSRSKKKNFLGNL